MAIKVLVISDYTAFHTSRPEAEIYVGLAQYDFDITVMTYGKAEYASKFKEVGIKVIDFHPEKKFDKKEIAFIRQYIIDHSIDILHVYNSVSTVNGIRAAKGLDVKVVLYRGYAGHLSWWSPNAHLKYYHPRVDKIVCNSKGIEDIFKSKIFFDSSKAVTINKGHRTEWYSSTKPADLSEFNLPENAFVLINVANNRAMKGIKYLVEAFNSLPEELPIYLLLVGRDMDNKENQSRLTNSINRKKLIFTGHRSDALSLVAASDVFVLSSIKGESITKAVLEAMSLGIAPIITDIPGNLELVENNISGLVVRSKSANELKEAILKLYNNQALKQELGIKAKERIDTVLNSKTTIQKIKTFYEELARKK
jgi:glycosyltransferase involved in cell wall biosynthesis